MPWLTLLRLVLIAGARLASIVREKRLMKAGAAHALRQALIEQEASIGAALNARRKVRAILQRDPGALHDDDGYRRD